MVVAYTFTVGTWVAEADGSLSSRTPRDMQRNAVLEKTNNNKNKIVLVTSERAYKGLVYVSVKSNEITNSRNWNGIFSFILNCL